VIFRKISKPLTNFTARTPLMISTFYHRIHNHSIAYQLTVINT
jgi:hypothetical protein